LEDICFAAERRQGYVSQCALYWDSAEYLKPILGIAILKFTNNGQALEESLGLMSAGLHDQATVYVILQQKAECRYWFEENPEGLMQHHDGMICRSCWGMHAANQALYYSP